MTSKDRALRLDAHKIHLVALIANAKLRNAWANDMLLKVSVPSARSQRQAYMASVVCSPCSRIRSSLHLAFPHPASPTGRNGLGCFTKRSSRA